MHSNNLSAITIKKPIDSLTFLTMTNKQGFLALSPLLVFVATYLTTSILAGDFYKTPISVAFLLSSMYAVSLTKGKNLRESIDIFSRGASTNNIMLMLWIFVLAGAFASAAKAIGSVDATVGLMLSVLPENMVLPGLFLATCFISLSIGTSVGTIVALVPIAVGLASSTQGNMALTTAVVVGGAFFGDNLSFISDTTIAATSSQGCTMKDKFKVNFYITLPAALVILFIYTFMGLHYHSTANSISASPIKVLPYIAVLGAAIAGMNVMRVLTIGIILTGIIGIGCGIINVFDWLQAMGTGITSMGNLIIVTMLAGGMFEIVRHNGGIDYIISKISIHIRGKRGAELVIGFLVGIIDLCTANNTVAIISVGSIAKRIGKQYNLDNRRVASLLDTCSCCMQGILPYGAQLLMAAGLSGLNPLKIIPYLYYPFALAGCVVIAVLFRYPKKYS